MILINPENHYAFKHKDKPNRELLISNIRDESIQKNLTLYIDKNKDREYRFDTGIIFGDAHMPYIYEILKEKGFNWSLEEKIFVY